MENDLPRPYLPTRYAKLGTEHPRQRHWSYIKHRKNPTGKLGRPKSNIPVAERRRKARQQYQANLAQRGQRLIRIVISTAAADRLIRLAQARGVPPGQILEDLLSQCPDDPTSSAPQ